MNRRRLATLLVLSATIGIVVFLARDGLLLIYFNLRPEANLQGRWEIQPESKSAPDDGVGSGSFIDWVFDDGDFYLSNRGFCGLGPAPYRAGIAKVTFFVPETEVWREYDLRFDSVDSLWVSSGQRVRYHLIRRAD